MTVSKYIEEAYLFHGRFNLLQPYRLSFSTVKYFDSFLVKIVLSDGSNGIGEIVPLTGYSAETPESIIYNARKLFKDTNSISTEEFIPVLEKAAPDAPAVRSAFATAVELAEGSITIPPEFTVPIIAPISTSFFPEKDLHNLLHLYHNGFRCIKVKIGKDIKQDLASTRVIIEHSPPDILLRFDANQGYSDSEARSFLNLISQLGFEKIEVIEQPFPVTESGWQSFKELSQMFPQAPLMLDESICSLDDVSRAAEFGAKLIKTKLMKYTGTRQLLAIFNYAQSLGLQVVSGNGVATEITNIIENTLHFSNTNFFGASEATGFLKIAHPPTRIGNIMNNGNVTHNLGANKIVETIDWHHYHEIAAN